MNTKEETNDKFYEYLAEIAESAVEDINDTIETAEKTMRKSRYREGYIDGLKGMKEYIGNTLGNAKEIIEEESL